jgi:hypothetical protein
MIEANDIVTLNLLPACDLAGERPAKPSRLQKMRAKNGLAGMTVNIDAALLDEFNAYLARTGKKRNAVITHLLKTQVLRKR